jgi:hypothetical protein
MGLLKDFLKESEIYGGNYEALTESEARTLIHAKGLDEARNRRTKARQTNSSRDQYEILSRARSETSTKSIGSTPLGTNPITAGTAEI